MKLRIAFGSLAVAASTLVGIALSEGWEGTAKPPIKGDVPTYGFGTTRHSDGSPVKAGEQIAPPKALGELLREVQAMDGKLAKCIGDVPLYPHEKSAYLSLAYNVGPAKVCSSSIPARLRAGQYDAACRTILDFDGFRDRTKPKVKNPRTGVMEYPLVKIKGLTLRREREYRECMGHA